MKGVSIRDMLSFRYLSSLRFSPGGRYAAFVVHEGDEEENGYKSNIWLYNTADSSCKRLTAFDKEAAFIWEDGETILFPGLRGEKDKKEKEKGEELTVFYRISIHGGEATEAFRVPLSVGTLRKINDDDYILLASYDNARAHLEGLSGEERTKALETLKQDEDYEVIDEVPFWSNGNGFVNKKRSRLYRFTPSTGKAVPITSPLFEVEDFDLNKEKTRLVYTGLEFADIKTMQEQMCLYTLENGATEELIPYDRFTFSGSVFMDDYIVFGATEHKNYGMNENPCFYTCDLKSKEVTLLAPFDNGIGASVGSDVRFSGGISMKAEDGVLYFISTAGADANLYALSGDGTIRQVNKTPGSIDLFDISDGKVLFVGLRDLKLQELYSMDPTSGDEAMLTSFNQDFFRDMDLSVPEPLSFTNSDGVTIDGWVMKPLGYEKGKKYPALIDIHGGPKTVYGPVYYHEMQVWAAKGYFVFFCNPRGGDGKGNAFADIRGKYGYEDYQDLMEFTDRVLDKYPAIDTERLGVTGGSYGGFMTNWIIGHTDRFAAAVSQRSISNWITMEHTSDIGYFFAGDQAGASTWTDLEKIWDHSPLKYADKCTTPTLFIHSREDYRCWEVECIQMYTALKLHGIDSRICLFKGENHELSRSGKPRHRIRRLEEITGWFEKYLK